MSLDPAELARQWARELPRDFARRLAAALRGGSPDLLALKGKTAQAASAAAVSLALAVSKQGDGPYAAGLLAGRLDALDEQPRVRPVWTGPQSTAGHTRLTLAVVADLLDQAKQEILLVSYATVPGENVCKAMQAAHDRGVKITLLLERTADNVKFSGPADPFPGLPARRIHWPAERRPSAASMHAKLLVVDRRIALIGSANLTGHALERNLECGVLVRGGAVPAQLVDHISKAQDIRAC